MSLLYHGIKAKLWPPTNPINASFSGKTIIVTGANTGLGWDAALKFVAQGAARIIFAVRSIEKGNAAKIKIESLTNRRGVVEVWQLDMNSYDSIRSFASRVDRDIPRLDIAVLNAGVVHTTYATSSYGWERTLQINTLSTTLLALHLLPKLKASSKTAASTPVLEIVSSTSIYTVAKSLSPTEKASPNLLEAFNYPPFKSQPQYAKTKVLIQSVVETLALIVDPKEVIVTSVCPGPCFSDIAREHMTNPIIAAILGFLLLMTFRTTEQGARTYVSATQQGERVHGRMWKDDQVQPHAPLLDGQEGDALRKKAWFDIIDALRKDVPEVVELAKA
ncbi:putative short-chain dehydrogenase/reductase family protein [Saccharata proteae CBS 121410]|uniref:Short-chain dehydrogenase/reductase family protein n=1 Tax=Saccharata proteae CBS 121410 TaxID=1314787 RepID=A0A9P4HYI1_9PEZI|nr:putative short-chain dehydrogenase/reductase family protein [Saccharata proteae CBS 121410]